MDTVCKHGVEYELSSDKKYYIASRIDNSYSPSGLTASLKVLCLSKKINGKSVKKIKTEAFKGCDLIEVAYIPETIEYIGHQAFAQCKSLKEINWYGDVNTSVELGHLVFLGCENLVSVTINSFLNPGTKDFCKCYNLTNFQCGYIENVPTDFFIGCRSLSHLSFVRCKKLNRGSFMGTGIKSISFHSEAPVLCDGTVEQWKQDGIEISCLLDNPIAELSYEGIPVSII